MMIFFIFIAVQISESSNTFQILLTSNTVASPSIYNMSLVLFSSFPDSGMLRLNLPDSFPQFFTPSCSFLNPNVQVLCEFNESSLIFVPVFTSSYSSGSNFVFSFNNGINPTPAVSMQFELQTLNKSMGIIDSYKQIIAFSPMPLKFVNIVPNSLVNGASTSWILSTYFDLSVTSEGYLSLYMPKWNTNLSPSTFEDFWTGEPICNMSCILNGDFLYINITAPVTGNFWITMSNLKNPPNTQAVSGFTLATYSKQGQLQDSFNLNISVSSNQGASLGNPALQIINPQVNALTSYFFSFFTINPITSSLRIKIYFSNDIQLQVTNVQTFYGFDSVSMSINSNQVELYNIVNYYQGPGYFFNFSLSSCVNPSSNKPTNISIYLFNSGYLSDFSNNFMVNSVPGSIFINSITSNSSVVNTNSQFLFNFYSQISIQAQYCIYIKFPAEIKVDNQKTCAGNLIGINPNSACNVTNNEAFVTNAFFSNFGTGNIQLGLSGILTPNSTKPTSPFLIVIYSSNNFLYQVSTNSTYQFVASPGSFISSITPSNYKTSTLANYSVSLYIYDTIPRGGYLLVTMPSEIVMKDPACVAQFGFDSGLVCLFVGNQINLTQGFLDSDFTGNLNFLLVNLTNPQSTRPTSSFIIETYTQGYLIDYVSTGNAITMNALHELAFLGLNLDSSITGTYASYYFSMVPYSPLPSGSIVLIFPPSEVVFNNSVICTCVQFQIQCNVINNYISISMNNLVPISTNFTLLIQQIKNPGSVHPISFEVTTTDGTYNIDSSTVTYSELLPNSFAKIEVVSLYNYINTTTTVNVSFTSSNLIPINGYLQISLDFLSDFVTCTLNSLPLPYTFVSNFTIHVQIPVQISFSNFLVLQDVKNPDLAGNYSLKLVSFSNNSFQIDSSSVTLQIGCKSPCQTCLNSASDCLSCISSSESPYFWNNSCNSGCDIGFYQGLNFECLPCDSPCLSCSNKPNGCTQCKTGFLYNSTCVSICPSFTYLLNSACLDCAEPCKTCSGDRQCLSCLSPFNLYENSCITNCPTNTSVAVNQICTPCFGCLTCINSPDFCTSCNSNSFLYNNLCFSNCPNSTFVNGPVCSQCSSNCKTCKNSANFCTSCERGWSLSQVTNSCVSICDAGYYYNNSICVTCNKSCSTCSISECFSCNSGYLLQGISCVSQCSVGFYESNTFCLSCPNGCLSCANEYICTSCSQNLVMYASSCLHTCPSGTFNENGTCISCGDCPVCSLDLGCLYCDSGLYFFNGSCIKNCPKGHLESGNMCLQCQNCSVCEGNPYNCSECESGFFLFGNTCLKNCPEGYAAVNGTCQINTTGLCAPGCTEALLNNSICDSLCNTKKCDFDQGRCSSVPASQNLTFSNEIDWPQNPFLFTGFGLFGLGTITGLSFLTTASFFNTILPFFASLQSCSLLTLLISEGQARYFHGRVLEDSESKLSVIFSILLMIFLMNFLINICFAVVYWKFVRKSDVLHRNWIEKHRWGIFFVTCFIILFSHRCGLLIVSNFPGIQVFQGKFEKISRLHNPLKYTELISTLLTIIPLISVCSYILSVFSIGNYVFIISLDILILTILSEVIALACFLYFLFKNAPAANKTDYIDDSNLTIEVTPKTDPKPQIIKTEINIEEEETNRDQQDPSVEGPVGRSEEINYKFKVSKKPLRKHHFSFGFSDLFPKKISDESLIDFENFTIDFRDLRKIQAKIKGLNSKVTLLKDFFPPIVVDDDGEVSDMRIDINHYELVSIEPENPKIGIFQHKVYKTKLKLMRSFVGAVVIDPEDDYEGYEDKDNLDTQREKNTPEKPIIEWDISEIANATDSFLSMKSSRTGFGSSKILMRSGSPIKLSSSRIIIPHPGIEEPSFDTP